MHQRIGEYSVLLLQGTLDNDNLGAIINKANDLFSGEEGFMQCCSLKFVPSENFALHAVENVLSRKPAGSVKLNKLSLGFLLWLYCTNQLEKAISLAAQGKEFLLVIAAKDKKLASKALSKAKELGFREEKGLIEKNFREKLDSFIEHFRISKNELRAFSHLPREKAVELLAIERQALLSL